MRFLEDKKNNRKYELNPFRSLFDDDFFDFTNTNELMRTDVKTVDDNYVLEISLPGFEKQDITINIENGYLNVSASKNKELDDDKNNYIRRERYYGSCSRSFYVGDINELDVKAKYVNGVLSITFPKKLKEVENKKIVSIE